jgi:hypothetical protein
VQALTRTLHRHIESLGFAVSIHRMSGCIGQVGSAEYMAVAAVR